MTSRFTINWPLTTCARCGAQGFDHVHIMFVKGSICRDCQPAVEILAERHKAKHDSKFRKELFHAMVKGVGTVTIGITPDLVFPPPVHKG